MQILSICKLHSRAKSGLRPPVDALGSDQIAAHRNPCSRWTSSACETSRSSVPLSRTSSLAAVQISTSTLSRWTTQQPMECSPVEATLLSSSTIRLA